jgi:Neuraminidase (sialidase)
MKTLTSLLTTCCILSAVLSTQAQSDSVKITQNALMYADSLVKTDSFETWPVYADLAQASVIKYYGGKQGYIDHILERRWRTRSNIAENSPELKMIQLVNVLNDEWQCVIRESSYFHKDDQKYHFITYFVGQSKDGGETWRVFDVSYNTVANIIYMFPDIHGDLEIKEPTILTPEQELAQQPKAAPNATRTSAKMK